MSDEFNYEIDIMGGDNIIFPTGMEVGEALISEAEETIYILGFKDNDGEIGWVFALKKGNIQEMIRRLTDLIGE